MIRLSGDMYILTGLTSVLFRFWRMLNSSSSAEGLGGLESVKDRKFYQLRYHKDQNFQTPEITLKLKQNYFNKIIETLQTMKTLIRLLIKEQLIFLSKTLNDLLMFFKIQK